MMMKNKVVLIMVVVIFVSVLVSKVIGDVSGAGELVESVGIKIGGEVVVNKLFGVIEGGFKEFMSIAFKGL